MSAATVLADLRPRNQTEEAILASARELLDELGVERLTIDRIARRAHLSRTAVYFYFPHKRAVVDRVVQQTFADIRTAASPYLEGGGKDARRELRAGIAGVVRVVERNAHILRVTAEMIGVDGHLPSEWEPFIQGLVRAAESRIDADQRRGIAPADIPARIAAQALCAMVERHLTADVFRGGGNARESIRVLADLWWRAVYAPRH